ncbi:MAG: hypothetical protein ACREDK_02810 [Thermoplasmata archaeon]
MNASRLGLGLAVIAALAVAGMFGIGLTSASSAPPAAISGSHFVGPAPFSSGPHVASVACNYTVIVTALPSTVRMGEPVQILANVVASSANAAHCDNLAVIHFAGLPIGVTSTSAPIAMGVAQQVGSFDVVVTFTTPFGSGTGATTLVVQP